MATKQGMCRNCGSLVVFDDRDDTCECVFCHCVFPSEEAVALLENPEGHEFKNEKFEAKEGGKHYYSNPVMPDQVQKAVARDAVSSKGDDLKLKPSEFEVSPNDVKAPKKLVIAFAAATLAVILIVLAISFPLFNSRTKLRQAIEADINTAFDSVAKEDSTGRQYIIYGLSSQYIKLSLPSGIDKATAQNYYSKYCELRASKREGKSSGNVQMEIFTPDTIYYVNGEGVKDDVQETVVITESTAAASESKK
ncbi:MAG: hypothetical protein IKT20_07450 [Clostridiales bacterium]|nr:hypothetical protein [Clostridiales bacterium]MBR6488731.1 hypothetical protein [Clostridiales bacterium]